MDIEGSRQRLQEITISSNNNASQHNGGDVPCREDQIRFNKLCKNARRAAEEGQPREALESYMKAAEIHNTEKISRRIKKLQDYLEEHGSEDSSEEESGMIHVGKGFSVYKDVYNQMYPHQRDAMLWFWRLHRKQKGGVLGDDMGLGKTIQVIAFLSGLFDMDEVHSVMLILPVAVMINWEKEFDKWAPGIRVESFHSGNKRERLRSLAKVQRHGGVLMTSYGLVVTNWENLGTQDGREFVWDYTILDEGHKIKNPSKTTKACHSVASKHRLILTGTPIQNNLKEFWFLFDFVTQGTLLGTQKTFQMEYAGPITRAREKDATASEKLLGNQMAVSLRQLIAPYFLRRTKADVLEKSKENQAMGGGDDADAENQPSTSKKVVSFPTLTRKNDFVVWCFLTDKQIKIYKDFLDLDQVKELLMTSRSPLVELTVLKKLCDHLRLLSVRACMQLGMDTGMEDYDEEDETLHKLSAADKIHHMTNEELLSESGKLLTLMDLLKKLSLDGHRTLVFSQSRKILDIIEKLLTSDNYKYLRLDGTISKLDDRQKRINCFQKNRSYTVFLLTTQVGGVGLTLTGADRVVIFDPSWNPATDNQAVDRVYRIGQKETVVVYRLITCGTVEEKIYRRQIFKESITNQTVGCTAAAKNPYRYFTKGELKELFTLDNPKCSTTQRQLEQMHAAQRKTDIDLDEHIAFLYSLPIFGISDHDLMFSKEAVVDHGADDIEEADDYIQQRVNRAKDLLTAESELTHKLRENLREDTEHPGINRRHTLYTDREKLLEEAKRQGHDVELPQQRPRWNDHGVTQQPNDVIDLDEYESSFEEHNNSGYSNSGPSNSGPINSGHNTSGHTSGPSNSGHNNSVHRGSSIDESNTTAESNDESFLQDMISTLSQEEIELNMRLLEANKAQQQQHQQQAAIQEEEQDQSNLNESSFLEDVLAEDSPDPNQAESSLEDVEVADQSLETSSHQETSNKSQSFLDDVEVADQSLETSLQNVDKNLYERDIDETESSTEEVEVADQSLETSNGDKSLHNGEIAGTESSMEEVEIADQSVETSGNKDNSDEMESSMEEVEVADQSLETSVHQQDEDEVGMNVSLQAMKLEDDVANLSMEDLARADSLDVCDNLDLHIPTPKKNARKSSSSAAPSPYAETKAKKRHPSSLLSTMNDSAASLSSPLENTKVLVEESPMADVSVFSDESETRKKRKSDESMSSSDEKRKYVEDDEDADESLPWISGAGRDRALQIQDLDDSEDNSDIFSGKGDQSITVIEESDEETTDDSITNEPPVNESEHGSYLTDSRKKKPAHSIEDESTLKIPTPREMLQYKFDDSSGNASKLYSIERTESAADGNEKGSDLQADDTVAWSKNDDDFDTDGDDDIDLEQDETVDQSLEEEDEEAEELEDKTGDEDADMTNEDRLDEEAEENITEAEENRTEEGGDEQSTTLNSEDSFEEEEEDYDEEVEDYDDEEEEEEDEEEEDDDDDDEYSQLVRKGESHLSNEDEAKALECFLRALKIDKSDKTLQMKTLTLYQKLSK